MRVPGEVTEAALTGSLQKSGIPLIGDSVNGPAGQVKTLRHESFRREETQGASYVHRSGTYSWDQRPSERHRYLVRTLATLMAYP
jgi:hypothetical protein